MLDVLIPTFERPAALAVTLTSLTAQDLPDFRVVVSDQGEKSVVGDSPEVRAAVRVLRAQGREVTLHRHRPRRGLAEHRAFLLSMARNRYALFLDDDVLCGPRVVSRLCDAIVNSGCGFVGMPLVGLSHLEDVRPHEQDHETWDTHVSPESVHPSGPEWKRHTLHNAANAWHVQQGLGLSSSDRYLYKVAWIGGCVMYDVHKLNSVGGFDFWRDLPPAHCGEDALAQQRVMSRFGGCGLLPTEAFHLEVETTVPNREVNAPEALPAVL